MKTKNNVRKAILKSAAVIVSLVLISFTVNAQNFWKSLLENETFSQIAMAMVANDSESVPANGNATDNSAADAFTAYSAIEPEESLRLEDWMTNEEVFNENVEAETEAPMELENWMTNESLFNATTSEFAIETEPKLELENWMVNDDVFNADANNSENKIYSSASFVYKNIEEPKLQVENWMLNSKTWSK